MYPKSNLGYTASTSPFGQSSFQKPVSSGNFGQTSFGQQNTSLFGSTQPQTSSFFGSGTTNTFGTATPQTGFGGFQQQQQQQPQNTSLFAPQQNGIQPLPFGQAAPSAFGAPPKAAGFGYNQNTSSSALFGQTNTTTNTGFGTFGSNTNSNVFGNNMSAFGQPSIGANSINSGTSVSKYQPLVGTDTIVKGGQQNNVNTKQHCITAMKEYETKSLEELRVEDYTANRKGPQGATANVFGAPQPAATGGLFASSNQQTSGLFGQQNEKSLFGGTSNITGSNFGQMNNTAFGQTAQPQGGFFSKPFSVPATSNTAFGGFGTTDNTNTGFAAKPFTNTGSTNLFGQPAQQPAVSTFNQPGGFTGFGANNPQPTMFGSTGTENKTFGLASATTNSGFSNFGGINNTNTTAGGLFAKTTGFATNTGFTGAAANTNTFGVSNFGATTNTNSIFNNSLAKPPSTSFGSFMPQASVAPLGGGLNFNNNNQNLFGNTKSGTVFGNTSQPNNNIFGSNQMFGNMNSLGGFNNNTSMNFNTNTGAAGFAQTAVPIHQQILSLTTSPYGDNKIFKDINLSQSLESDSLRTTNPAAQKAILESSGHYKVTNKYGNGLKVKPVGGSILTKKALFDGLEEYDSSLEESFSSKRNSKRLIIKSKPTLDTSTSFKEISSPLKIIENPSSEKVTTPRSDNDSSRRESWLNPHAIEKLRNQGLHSNSVVENTINELVTESNNSSNSSGGESLSKNLPGASNTLSESLLINESTSNKRATDEIPEEENVDKTNCAGIILNRVGYYTRPPLSELSSYITRDGKCVVPNFTIGREGYGNVYFNTPVDISGINFDEIVHFRHKEVIIYPGEHNKPPLGEGLNREAQVTLDQVWPHDKTLHEPIKDIARLEEINYEEKLRRVCDKYDIRFIDYRPETGSWVFKVKHFSKYGLTDSDEEIITPTKLKPKDAGLLQTGPPIGTVIVQSGIAHSEEGVSQRSTPLDYNKNLAESLNGNGQNDVTMTLPMPMPMPNERDTDPHKLQLMKSSFFAVEEMEYTSSPSEVNNGMDSCDQIVPHMNTTTNGSNLNYLISKENLQPPENTMLEKLEMDITMSARNELSGTNEPNSINVKPDVLFIKPTIARIINMNTTFKNSIKTSARSRCISDLALFNCRRFKVNFGPRNTLLIPTFKSPDTSSGINYQSLLDVYSEIDNSSKYLKITKVTADLEPIDEIIVPHLQLQLNNSLRIETPKSNCPHFKFGGGDPLIPNHLSIAEECPNHKNKKTFVSVLSLCLALWGNNEEIDDHVPSSHFLVMYRKNVLSQWLENTINEQSTDTTIKNKSGVPCEILKKLHCHKVAEACQLALDNSEPFLALLLSQISSGQTIRQLIQYQLTDWQKVKADAYINDDTFKILMLISGIHVMPSGGYTKNVLQGLHWLNVVAIHLWYLCTPTSCITDAVLGFETLLNAPNSFILPPYPDYVRNIHNSAPNETFDIKYHLLQVFSRRSYSVESIIDPLSHTPDLLDHKLSWIMLRFLKDVGYTHCSKLHEIKLHTDFANQLEYHGLWQWSIFVLLHIEDVHKRELRVQETLYRNVTTKKNEDLNENEKFVINALGIPCKWVYWAKAVKSGTLGQFLKQSKYLLKAKQWWAAHDVIMAHIAPTAVINEKLDFLYDLLIQLENLGRDKLNRSMNWNCQGQIVLDFLKISKTITKLQSSDEGNIEGELDSLKPELADLCSRTSMFSCPTAVHRLCQSEMAQKLACFVRGYFLTGENTNPCLFIKIALEKLPLPQEFAQQELRILLDTLVTETFK